MVFWGEISLISYNNKDDFESMQQEAIRRVHEMQKKADSYINSSNNQYRKSYSNPESIITEQPQLNTQQNNNRTNINNTASNKNNSFNQQKQIKSQTQSRQTVENKKPVQDNSLKNKSNHQNGSNPYSQLFGSNLGGFNRYKNESNNHNKSNGILPSEVTNSINKILHDVSIDEEKLLILILIYILYKNGADMKLIIALGYLII